MYLFSWSKLSLAPQLNWRVANNTWHNTHCSACDPGPGFQQWTLLLDSVDANLATAKVRVSSETVKIPQFRYLH